MGRIGLFALILLFHPTHLYASDRAVFAELPVFGDVLSIPISQHSIVKMSGPERMFLGNSSHRSNMSVKRGIEKVSSEGSKFISASFVIRSACLDGFLISKICDYTQNRYSEDFTIYDVEISPFDERRRYVTAKNGGTIDHSLDVGRNVSAAVVIFGRDPLQTFSEIGSIAYFSFVIRERFLGTVRIFIRNRSPDVRSNILETMSSHFGDIALATVRADVQ